MIAIKRSYLTCQHDLSNKFPSLNDLLTFSPSRPTFCLTHHSKRTCDLKQNGTQEKAPFSGIVFCALALGVVCFVPSVSSRNHFLIGQNSSFSQWEASIWWFQKLTVRTKRTTPQERQWETVPENSVFSWVPFCLRSLGPFERCEIIAEILFFEGGGLLKFVYYGLEF